MALPFGSLSHSEGQVFQFQSGLEASEEASEKSLEHGLFRGPRDATTSREKKRLDASQQTQQALSGTTLV